MVNQPLRRRHRISFKSLCLLLIGLYIGCSNGAANEVYFYSEKTSDSIDEFYKSLESRLKKENHSLIRVDNPLSAKKNLPIIVIQPSTETSKHLQNKNTIGVFKPFLDAYLIKDSIHKQIINDPYFGNQIDLAKSLFPKKEQIVVGVILSEKYRPAEKKLKDIALAHNAILKIEYTDGQPLKALAKINNIDALIALPDQNIFNRDTIKSIIKTTYNNNIPLIGFYKGMVDAGATATTYFTIDDILERVVEVILTGGDDSRPNLTWPQRTRSHINQPVIESMSLQVPIVTHEVKL